MPVHGKTDGGIVKVWHFCMQSLGYGTFASKLCLWILWWTCHGLTKGIKKIIQTGKWRWFCLCQCHPGSWKAHWIAVKSHCSKIFFIRLWGILWPIVEMWKLKLLNPFNITERPYPGNALWADTDGTLLFSCLHWLRIEPLRNNHCLSFPPALPSVLVSAWSVLLLSLQAHWELSTTSPA